MNDHTDEWNPDLQPGDSQDEDRIEDALKWLEGLTGAQGEQPPASNPSLESPFHGLIGGDEGDLPDWLREVPSALSSTQGEMESRLDWLAKMAQRESIEELPTLEWRRLSEPAQNTVQSARGEETAADAGAEMLEQEQPEPSDLASSEPAPEPDNGDDLEVDSGMTELNAPELYDFEETPVEDLDAAMAWIEELAASQDAPVEDIPTVADRALTSKLMMEAGLTDSPMDEMISDSALLDSIVPDNPFLEEEDSADTIVLGETTGPDGEEYTPTSGEPAAGEAPPPIELAAEETTEELPPETETPSDTVENTAGSTSAIPDEPVGGDILTAEEPTGVDEAAVADEVAAEETDEPLSVAAAMALLDEMATTPPATTPPVETEPDEPEPVALVEASEMAAEELTPEAAEASDQPEVEIDAYEAEPSEPESLLAGEAPWSDELGAALTTTQVLEPESEVTEIAAGSDLPLETPAGLVEGEMIVASDELLESLEDEVLSVEEAPWYEEPPAAPELEDEPPVAAAEEEVEFPLIPPLPTTVLITDEAPPFEAEASLEETLPESDIYEEVDDDIPAEIDAEESAPAAPIEEQAAGEAVEMTVDRDGARLEEALLAIDSLALPAGKTLAEIDAVWGEGLSAPRRDVMTALDWLESALAPPQPAPPGLAPSPVLDETQLIEHMPDDPDAVLAWLEQMSDEASTAPASPAHPPAGTEQPEPGSGLYDLPEDELLEADLLAMPDDPDEAMIWLESLARGGEPPPMPSKVEPATPEELELPRDSITPEPEPGAEGDEGSNPTDLPGEPGDVKDDN